MKKIFIAFKDEFINRIYADFFREENFLVFNAKDEDLFSLILNNTPDVILLDVVFAEKDNFKILRELRDSSSTKKIPVILISHSEDVQYREKAIEFEVKDFLVGEYNSPLVVISKIKTHLEGERSYQLPVDINNEKVIKLSRDIGYESLFCNKCSSNMEMNLIRDSGKGKNYFKLSFICPKCKI